MTALKQYERIEATGLWRPTAEEQRREVVVSIGEATLTISDFNDSALTHWSLAALVRQNPGEFPAVYHPDGDPGETLELAESETTMIEAIERLQRAIDRARPHPGRLRLVSILGVGAALAAVLVFWLPGAMKRHTVSVVPDIKRQEIGRALLDRIERVGGRECSEPDADPILRQLAARTGVDRLAVVPAGVADSLHLPGGIVLLNRTLIEDHEDPAVAAGFVLAERARAEQTDPLDEILGFAGAWPSFRLLTTGDIAPNVLDRYAEYALAEPRSALDEDATLALFAQAAIPSSPYAYALDVTGETVLGLIEADPMAGRTLEPVLPDRDWVLLQSICDQ
jgi:GNAT superfamily N-acetyltransferase